jgi:hypothetical protein
VVYPHPVNANPTKPNQVLSFRIMEKEKLKKKDLVKEVFNQNLKFCTVSSIMINLINMKSLKLSHKKLLNNLKTIFYMQFGTKLKSSILKIKDNHYKSATEMSLEICLKWQLRLRGPNLVC